VPEAALSSRNKMRTDLLDQLISSARASRWNCEAESLRSFEIDDQLKSCGLLDGQVGRFLPLEDAPGVNAGQIIGIQYVGPIAHQAAGHSGIAPRVNRWQRVVGSQRNNLVTAAIHELIASDNQSTDSSLKERSKCSLDIVFGLGLNHY
jgi:hypothetical protein